MSKTIWAISDLHYNHEKIISFVDYKGNRTRNFDSVDQMNECILDRWNSVVKPGDIVYCLGDVFLGDKEKFKKDWPKFNGSKRLTLGNHDDPQFLSSGGFFKKVMYWRSFPEYGLMMHHTPLHITSLLRSKSSNLPLFQIHGHTHTMGSPRGPYSSVCVEMIDYTPVAIEDLAEKAKTYFATQWESDKQFIEGFTE